MSDYPMGECLYCQLTVLHQPECPLAPEPSRPLLPTLLDQHQPTEDMRTIVRTAARAAAEDMRAKAVALATKEREAAERMTASAATEAWAYWDGRRAQAKTLEKWIAELPLPGDEEAK